MQIRCKLTRLGGTFVNLAGHDYHFTAAKPEDPRSPHLCNVDHVPHIQMLMSVPEAYAPYGDEAVLQWAELADMPVEQIIPAVLPTEETAMPIRTLDDVAAAGRQAVAPSADEGAGAVPHPIVPVPDLIPEAARQLPPAEPVKADKLAALKAATKAKPKEEPKAEPAKDEPKAQAKAKSGKSADDAEIAKISEELAELPDEALAENFKEESGRAAPKTWSREAIIKNLAKTLANKPAED